MDEIRNRLAHPSLLFVFGVLPTFVTQFTDLVGVSLGPTVEMVILSVGFLGAALVSVSLGYQIGGIGWVLLFVSGPVLSVIGLVKGPVAAIAFFACLLLGCVLIVGDLFYTDNTLRGNQQTS